MQYKIANEKFLAEKAQEEGIKALESGILIRELEKGSGSRTPQLRSTVYVHYTAVSLMGRYSTAPKGNCLPASG